MAEQVIDVRALLSLLRRHRRLLAGAALLGAAAGVGLSVVDPPPYVSTSEVLLPQGQSGDSSTQIDPQTQALIASSEAVLGPAGKAVRPVLSFDKVRDLVKVEAPSTQTIRFEASASTPQLAESLADAAAKAEFEYVAESAAAKADTQQAQLLTRLSTSLQTIQDDLKGGDHLTDPATSALSSQLATVSGQLDAIKAQANADVATASIIQNGSPASRPGPVRTYVIPAALGLIAALVVVSALLIAYRRRDRRARLRDEIAAAVGSPVLASLTSRSSRSAAGWTQLLEDYTPSGVDAWTLRQLIRELPGGPGRRIVTVLSLAHDAGGMSLGPLLASYAASTGIRTRLVVAQRHDSAAPLWAACQRPGTTELRPGLTASSDPADAALDDVDLVVVVAVVDRKDCALTLPAPTGIGLISVSAGAAEPEELARAAVSIDDSGGELLGLVVADPDELDRTTGRLMREERTRQGPLSVATAPSPRASRAQRAAP